MTHCDWPDLPFSLPLQLNMCCTVIVTIRAVLWYVTSLVGTLLMLVALFTNRWLHHPIDLTDAGTNPREDNTYISKSPVREFRVVGKC